MQDWRIKSGGISIGELEKHESVKALLEGNRSVGDLTRQLSMLIETKKASINEKEKVLTENTETCLKMLKIMEELSVKDAELNMLEKKALELLIQKLERM